MDTYQALFDFAVHIEENGMQFYQTGAKHTHNESLRILFNYLAEEETHHKQRFIQLKAESQHWDSLSDQTKENFKFLNAFVKNVVFDEEKSFDRDLIHSERELIRFALQRESESLLYYEEVKKLFSKQAISVLDEIIREEIDHYLKLSEMLEKF